MLAYFPYLIPLSYSSLYYSLSSPFFTVWFSSWGLMYVVWELGWRWCGLGSLWHLLDSFSPGYTVHRDSFLTHTHPNICTKDNKPVAFSFILQIRYILPPFKESGVSLCYRRCWNQLWDFLCFRVREKIWLYFLPLQELAIFTYLIFTCCKYSRNIMVLLINNRVISQIHDSACRLHFPSVSFSPIRQMTSALHNVPPSCF